ncbi:MAG TPA: NAD(P)-dependent oxidoreductase, partial [Candidatus Eremiobacteraceae bacterium]|nr:NAD(P)-dependent oxidoreductase [Candidatus Eremiobacteraceae bacterium]
GASVVFISSDYVFDGAKKTPYVESDATGPINAYGVSKLAGEMLVRQTNPAHYVVRIASVFGVRGLRGSGGNFVQTMLEKAEQAKPIEVIDDVVMSPTYSADAAALLVGLLVARAPFGIYHLTNAGACSWCEFANAIFELAGVEARAKPTKFVHEPGKVRRPSNSALASEQLGRLGLRQRPWRDGLTDYLAARALRR